MAQELYCLWRTFEFNANLELARLQVLEQEADKLLYCLDNRTPHVTFWNTDETAHLNNLSIEAQPPSSPLFHHHLLTNLKPLLNSKMAPLR
jgi:hypothetical protein